MNEPLKLMCIFAHPDDETLGMGPVLAKYAAEGIEISLITATRGERGWHEDSSAYPGPDALGVIREKELAQAVQVLGIKRVDFLGYMDGELNQADGAGAAARIASILREIRPQVVVSFGPDGDYGHPDHIAICQLASAALLLAADQNFMPGSAPAHRVSKFYYMVTSDNTARAFEEVSFEITIDVDGEKRTMVAWPEWAVTTRVQAVDYIDTFRQAVNCHQSQLPSLQGLETMGQEQMAKLVGTGTFFRVFSLVNSHQDREDDLFAGLK